MIKSVLKEICIMLLLCVAIVLVLGVIFYDYIPANKAVPNKLVAYSTPEDVKNKIEENIVEMEKENVTYTVTGADLNLYKQNKSYTAGKPDPFAASPDVNHTNNQGGGKNNTTNTSNNTATGNTTNNNNTNKNNTSTNTSTDPNSTGTFFNDTGLK